MCIRDSAKRDALRSKVADATALMLAAAAPGSDHQLQFARAFANNAVTPAHFEKIKAMLNGSENGLVLDADQRWYLFLCGVKRGIFGPAEIETESANDKTAHGKQYNAYAYAAIPTKDAKAKAFTSITTDNLSNTIHSYCLLYTSDAADE